MAVRTKYDWPHIGNGHIKEFLEKSLEKKRINNAFIFNGPDNLGKTTAAYFFSKNLLCREFTARKGACGACASCLNFQKKAASDGGSGLAALHGDFCLVKKDKEKKQITIEQVRRLIHRLSMTSFLGAYKIGVIKHADQLSEEASNALLKILEEPGKKVVIILITKDYSVLPETIVSRSQLLEFRPVATETIHDYLLRELSASRSQAKNYSRLSLGRPALAAKFAEDGDFYELYMKRAGSFLSVLENSDINSRLEIVNALMPDNLKGQEAQTAAGRILEVWEGILRDAMLMGLSLANLVQHEIIQTELDFAKDAVKRIGAASIFRILEEARENLAANVNPKFVLENVIVKI